MGWQTDYPLDSGNGDFSPFLRQTSVPTPTLVPVCLTSRALVPALPCKVDAPMRVRVNSNSSYALRLKRYAYL